MPGQVRWLGYSSFCWSSRRQSRCVDFIGPERRRDVPRLGVRAGERVRFHLAFAARAAFLVVGRSRVQRRLGAGRSFGWRVAGAGTVTLLAYRVGGGDASYVAILR